MTIVFLTAGSSWTVPDGWDSSNNTIEAIGAGGGGDGSSTGCGGGGGAYSKITGLTLTPGASVSYQIGQGSAGASGTDTWFSSTGTLLAKAGLYSAGPAGGAGGAAGSGVGTTKYSGGAGGSAAAGYNGGGGGAGGPNGTGAVGGAGIDFGTAAGGGGGGAGGGTAGAAGSGTTGGTGGNNYLGAGGAAGGASGNGGANGTVGGGGGGSGGSAGLGGDGGSGQDWDSTHGAGGGGGGGVSGGGAAGLYGAGGGGGSATAGAQGIIVITYQPLFESDVAVTQGNATLSAAATVFASYTANIAVTQGNATISAVAITTDGSDISDLRSAIDTARPSHFDFMDSNPIPNQAKSVRDNFIAAASDINIVYGYVNSLSSRIQTYVQDTQPAVPAGEKYIWYNTTGSDISVFLEDGT